VSKASTEDKPVSHESQTISVVLPVAKLDYFSATLDSWAAQTDQPDEIIVFTDGLTRAEQARVARGIENSGLDVQLVHGAKALGREDPSLAWNYAVELAQSDYVWMFSDDDTVDPKAVESLRAALKARPDAVLASIQVVDSNGEILRVSEAKTLSDMSDFLTHRFRNVSDLCLQALVVRKAVLKKINGYPQLPAAWGADDVLVARLLAGGVIHAASAVRVSWRLSDVSISGSTKQEILGQRLQAVPLVIQEIRQSTSRQLTRGEERLLEHWLTRQDRLNRPEKTRFGPFSFRHVLGRIFQRISRIVATATTGKTDECP
jgi:hypothetical protein